MADQQICQSSERSLKLFLNKSVTNKAISLQLWFNKSGKLQLHLSTAPSRRENRQTTANSDKEPTYRLITDHHQGPRLAPSLLSPRGQIRPQTRSVRLLQLFLQRGRLGVKDLFMRHRQKYLDVPRRAAKPTRPIQTS